MALLLLAATEALVRARLPGVRYDADFLLPGARLHGVGEFVQTIRARAARGARIVVILGDSTSLTRIPAGTRNLVAEFADHIRAEPGRPAVEVYNISAPGLDPASHYYLARALAPHVRAILFTINFRIFSTRRQTRLAYPELWHELRPAPDAEERAHLVLERGQGAEGPLAGVETRLDAVADRTLALKRRHIEARELVAAWLNPLRWFPGRAAAPARTSEWDLPLADWPAEGRARAIAYYAMSYRGRRYAADNADVFFTRRTFALADTTPCLMIGYAVPVSRWINARDPFLDWEDYAVNVGLIRPAAAGPRRLFLDYNDPVRPFDPVPGDRYFQSPEHMVHDGVRLFASRLAADTRAHRREALQ